MNKDAKALQLETALFTLLVDSRSCIDEYKGLWICDRCEQELEGNIGHSSDCEFKLISETLTKELDK